MTLNSLPSKLSAWLFEPPEHWLSRALMPLFKLLRYGYALLRDLMQGQLTLRAMSLVYTTLLSIAPLLALAFSVLKGLGYDQDLEIVLYQFFEPLGDKASELTARIMGFVNSVRGDVLGTFGLAFLIYTVISTVQKVEECFNFIWQVEKPRSWARRFSEYLSVMVIGPVVIVALVSILQADVVTRIGKLSGIAWTLAQFKGLGSFFIVSATLTFLYLFIPNTKVKFTSAAIGGLAAGALWTIGGFVFARFVASSAQTALIYAGFAIVIVALIWLYMSWLVLLLGAQISFYVQHPHLLRHGQREINLTAAQHERLGLSIMYLVARDYQQGAPHWTPNKLAEQFNVPSQALTPVINVLEQHQLLVRTEAERYLPGRNPEHIALHEIMEVLRNNSHNPRIPKVRGAAAAEQVAEQLSAAIRDGLGDKTLADLVA